jgi:hypothetical protein
MTLQCSYEELRALTTGAELALSDAGPGAQCAVAAPAEMAIEIDSLLPQLTGDLSISTLAEQRRLRSVVGLIAENLRRRMEGEIIEHHPGHEAAVLLYFDYAHTLGVLARLDRIGEAMQAVLELVSPGGAASEAANFFTFPD